MKGRKRGSRLISLFLTVALLLGLYVSPVHAATVGKNTKYEVTIRVADVSTAGTDSNIYFCLTDVTGTDRHFLMDESGNDFERGSKKTYYFTDNRPYWYITGYKIWNEGGDAMKLGDVTIVAKADGMTTQTVSRSPHVWLEYKSWSVGAPGSARAFEHSDYGDFSNLNGTVYLNIGENDDNELEVLWNSTVKDRIHQSYNPFEYLLAPSFNIKIEGASTVDGGWEQLSGNDVNQTIEQKLGTSESKGFVTSKKKVYDLMQTKELYALRITSTVSFGKNCSGVTSRKAVYTFYRKEFTITDPVISSSAFEASKDNYYFNTENKQITVGFTVNRLANYATEKSNPLVDKLADELVKDPNLVRLYYGPGENDYLPLMERGVYRIFGTDTLYLKFEIDKEYQAAAGASSGLKLYLGNATAEINKQKFQLFHKTSFNIKNGKPDPTNPKTVTHGGKPFNLGYGKLWAQDAPFTTHKLDNIAPTIGLSTKDNISNTWIRDCIVVTSPPETEIFADTSKRTVDNAGYLSLEVVDSKGGPVSFKNVGKSGTTNPLVSQTTISAASGQQTRLTFREPGLRGYGQYEGKDFKIRVTGYDYAGNKVQETIDNLWIDTVEPRVKMLNIVDRQEGSAYSKIFSFTIEDKSETAKLHYCFLEKGTELKDINNTPQGGSGEIYSLTNRWAFIEQGSVNSAAIVLKMEANENFEGDLVYYAVDDAGNETAKTWFPVKILNGLARCDVIVEPNRPEHPVPSYSIKFVPDADCDVFYRLAKVNEDNTVSSSGDFVKYNPKGNLILGAESGLLHGAYYLEYYVKNNRNNRTTEVSGAQGISLNFDNAVPEINIKQNTKGQSLAAHSFSISAYDMSGIRTASYTITPAGSDTAVASGVLESGGKDAQLFATVSTQDHNLANGAYVLRVSATDRNGVTSTIASDVFSVRNTAPRVTMTVNGKTDTSFKVTDPDYEMLLNVTDVFTGAAGKQSTYWRTSLDGINYTAWERLGELRTGIGPLTADPSADPTPAPPAGTELKTIALLKTPQALTEGLNTVYIQVICAEDTKSLSREAISENSIATAGPVSFLLDMNAPSARWRTTCARNNTALTGTLTVSDDLTAFPEVSCDVSSVTLTATEDAPNVYAVEYTVPAGEAQVPSFTLTVADEVGNTKEIVVDTSLLDVDGPAIAIGTPTYHIAGDRKDAVIEVTITDTDLGETQFDFGSCTAEQAIVRDLDSGKYEVRLRGFTNDSFSFTVNAEDGLGNESQKTSGSISVAYPQIAAPAIVFAPAAAIDSSPVILRFNTGVVAAQTREEAEALAERQIQNGPLSNEVSCMLDTGDPSLFKFVDDLNLEPGEFRAEFTVYAVDDLGEVKAFTIQPDTVFGKQFPIDVAMEQYVDGTLESGTPSVLVSGYHVADPTDPTDADREYAAYVKVSTDRTYYKDANGNIYHLSENVMRSLEDENGNTYEYTVYGPYNSAPAESNYDSLYKVEIERDGKKVGLDTYAFALNPFTYVVIGDSRVTDYYNPEYGWYQEYYPGDTLLFEDYDDKERIFFYDWDSHMNENVITMDGDMNLAEGYEFQTIAFRVGWNQPHRHLEPFEFRPQNLSSAKLNVGFHYVEYAAATEGMFNLYDKPEYWLGSRHRMDESAAMFGIILHPGASIWLNKAITIDTPIVTVQPQIEYSWSQDTIEAAAVVQCSAAGDGVDIDKLKLMKYDSVSDTYTTVAQIDPSAAGATPNLTHTVLETEAGIYRIYAENEYGLSTLSPDFKVAIKSDPISTSDYEVKTYSQPGVLIADDEYASEVTVVIEPTASGIERGLTAEDGFEVVLTPEAPAYVFRLSDDYGYTETQDVSFDRFDVTAPDVSYVLAGGGAKTNEPYPVTITATDAESGLASVTLTTAGSPVPLTQSGDKWTGMISKNGSYLITAVDKLGNRTLRTFTASNIDNAAIEMTVTFDVSVQTQGRVTATLSFNKPDVTITKAEAAQSSQTGIFSLNREAKTLTFVDNGTVSVFFRDSYGNEGSKEVTVGNIYKEPPQLVAEAKLAGDLLSVEVEFKMEEDAHGAPKDQFRKLSDLTVLYNGVGYNADGTKFQLRENGEYTFTIIDKIGLTQYITVTAAGIDREAPVITAVSWEYVYYDASGTEQRVIHSLDHPGGKGYVIAEDADNPRTNRDVTVTVKTDKETQIMGYHEAQKLTEHTLIYRENGMFVFNLERPNGMSANYGVDVEVIDKTAPVIELGGASYLLYVENNTPASIRDAVEDFTAHDVFQGKKTDLTASVEVDYGGLNVDNMTANVYDKSKPYTVTYTVKDIAGNETVATRTVVLASINDVLVTVNGRLPDASSAASVVGNTVTLELLNFSGVAYATTAPGMHTFGQMKTRGTLIPRTGSGVTFVKTGLKTGWHTFFVQTDTRDYFNIYVYVEAD